MSKPLWSVDQIVTQLTNWGAAWDNDSPVAYTFYESLAPHLGNPPNFSPFSAAQRQAVARLLELISDVANVDFMQVPDNSQKPGEFNQRFGMFNLFGASVPFWGAATNYEVASEDIPYGQIYGADLVVNGYRAVPQGNWNIGDSNPRKLLHELLHVMGLDHPGDYSGDSATYETDAQFFQDSNQYTVMSYWSAAMSGADHVVDGVPRFAATPLLFDVASLQALYGANMQTRTGDTVYGFHSTAGRAEFDFTLNSTPVITIWDAGGTDMLDFSGFSEGTLIDLNEGAFSSSPGMASNISIAFGAMIENALGGSGNDALFGNQGENRLYGGNGNDLLDGRGTIVAQSFDFLVGGLGNDIYYTYGQETLYEVVGEGFDTIYTNVSFGIPPGISIEQLGTVNWRNLDPFTLAGNDFNNSIIGNNGHNAIYGGAGDDSIRGLGGNDVMDGQSGTDYLIGGLGDDIYYVDGLDTAEEAAGEGYDSVYAGTSYVLNSSSEIEMLATLDASAAIGIALSGNQLNNYIVANAGDNILDGRSGDDSLLGLGGNDLLIGGTGVDYMIGGTGNDNYYVDTGDTIDELADEGSDSAYAGASYVLTAGSHVEFLGSLDWQSTAALDLTGNAFAQSIIGSNGANVLLGLGGDDSINGIDGADRIDGGAGQDFLQGGAGADTFLFTDISHSSAWPDIIADFESGLDKIDLTAIDADSGTAADDAFTFIGAGAFTGQAGQLRVDGGNGFWEIFGDTNGDSVSDFRITVYGPTPVLTDFNL